MFGPLLIMYLFLGGVAAGAFFVTACWSLAFDRPGAWHDARTRRTFGALRRRCHLVSLLVLIAAVLCLLWDLGMPERALLLFLAPHLTFVTLGSYALAALLLAGVFLVAGDALGRPLAHGRPRRVLEAASAMLSCVVMAYTGAFLASGTVPLWSTPVLVALFTLSSLSGGLSAVMLVDRFTQGRTVLLRSVRPLQAAHVACLTAEALALGLFLLAALGNPDAARSVARLLEPAMLANLAVGAVGLGIAAPLAAETWSLTLKEARAVPGADALCLVGGFMLRYCIIIGGAL